MKIEVGGRRCEEKINSLVSWVKIYSLGTQEYTFGSTLKTTSSRTQGIESKVRILPTLPKDHGIETANVFLSSSCCGLSSRSLFKVHIVKDQLIGSRKRKIWKERARWIQQINFWNRMPMSTASLVFLLIFSRQLPRSHSCLHSASLGHIKGKQILSPRDQARVEREKIHKRRNQNNYYSYFLFLLK